MPTWYYEQDAFHKTPSIQDGIDYDTECAYRKEGARFIMDIGTQMDLGSNTMATGVVFFHRFYMFHSFMAFPRFVTACCCIFLAGKVEETPKRCKDIIKIAQTILNEDAFATFGIDPKEEVMTLEKVLLQTIKFDFKVEHPYSFLIKYAKHLKGDKNKLHKMVQMAWTFINDSLCTTLCLQWEPEIIAIALMYLAGKLSKFKVVSWYYKKPEQMKWWDMFVENLEMSTLEDICHQVLDLYSVAKDKSQELQQTPSQTTKKNVDLKLKNPCKLKKKGSQQIQEKSKEKSLPCDSRVAKGKVDSKPNSVKNEPFIDTTLAVNIKKDPYCDSRVAKEVYSKNNSIKQEPSTDLTLAVNIKKEPELSLVHNQPKSKIVLQVAEWAAVSASAVMSPGTSSVNSPSFPTPNFLTSPVPIGSFSNHYNESTNYQNINFNKNLSKNCEEQKNVSAELLNSRSSSANFDDTTRHVSQSYSFDKLLHNVPSDNCRDNLPTSERDFDNYSDNIPKSSQGFDNCNDNVLTRRRRFDNCNDNLLKRSRGFDKCYDNEPSSKRDFGNYNNDVPFRSRGFGNYENSVTFDNRGIDNVNENSLDNNENFKTSNFSKNYLSYDMLIQDYPDSKNLYDKLKYSTEMQNDRDPRRTNSHPYLESKNGFFMTSFPESNNSYEIDVNFERYRSKHSGRRFKNSKRFRGPTNN